MSEFGGRADVQQIRVIALVMITVLPGSAIWSCPGLVDTVDLHQN
jgi:hypothetical protein